MKKTLKRYSILFCLIILFILYLLNSHFIVESIIDYTKRVLTTLAPSSFLFFIMSSLLIDYDITKFLSRILHKDGTIFYVTIMSLFSGFPSGAKYTNELLEKGIITKNLADYLICFTHFPNPIFLLGSLSFLYHDKKVGIFLLLSLILSNLLIAYFIRPKEKEGKMTSSIKYINSDFSDSLVKAIQNSFKVLLLIYGTSLFFFLIAKTLTIYLPNNKYLLTFFYGFFDLTQGLYQTKNISIPLRYFYILTFFSFGSISVHLQVKSLIESRISYKNFLLGRICQMGLSLIIFIILYQLGR